MTLDEAIAIAKKVSEDESADARGRKDYRQIAEWLEELKQYKEQNQETNLDHFKHEILENCLWSLAVAKGKTTRCDRISCSDCEFSKDRPKSCHENAMAWLKRPCTKSTCELTQFEYDLLQSCSQGYSPKYQFKNINSLTEMREKGYFKGIDRDATIEDILANCEIKEED